MSTVGAIVLAAGSGTRFGNYKQFDDLTPGVRLVDVAVEAVAQVADHLVLVVPPGHEWDGRRVDSVVAGGLDRLDSVAAGLAALPEVVDVVIVHDAVHPLAPGHIFMEVIKAVEDGADGAMPFLPMAQVVKRQAEDGTLTTVGREGLGLSQMPMAFSATALRNAHSSLSSTLHEYVEDSMLLEALGYGIAAVPGSVRNIHVVTEADLDLARAVASSSL